MAEKYPYYMDIPYSVYLFILMEIWVIFTFWLLRIMLLWTYMYKFLCGHMFSFLLGIYLGVELLDHMVSLCLTFWGTSKLYPKQLCNFTFPPAMCEGSNFSTSSLTLFIVHLFAYSHLSGYEVVALCGLCLDFLNEEWCWTYFNVLLGQNLLFWIQFIATKLFLQFLNLDTFCNIFTIHWDIFV